MVSLLLFCLHGGMALLGSFGLQVPESSSHHNHQLTVFALGLSMTFLQLYVLMRPQSSRYCGQPLLYNLVGSLVFTFFATGLALLLVGLEPIPCELRTTFFVFGMASFAKGACTTAMTALATQCAKTTPELYQLSVIFSVSSIISTTFFSVLGLFWLTNKASPGLILDKEAKTGICYKPVAECGCLWHV